jgi:rhodanese-related sulfurtransferase
MGRARIFVTGLMAALILGGCSSSDEGNSPPVISSVTASDSTPDPGETITLACTASDADGDALTYAWTVDGLAIGNTASIQWQAPASGQVTILVEVSDGVDSASRSTSITVRGEFNRLAAITDAQFATWATNWILPATTVHANLGQYFVVDLRSSQAFLAGHIPGARNASLVTLVSTVESQNSGGLPVLLACDTGQVAAFATMALRMLGHDAFSLQWGMAGWNDLLAGPWNAGISNAYESVMSYGNSPALPTFDWPELSTGLASGQAILQARVSAVLAEGFTANAVNAYEVMDNPGSFIIHNYWLQDDYFTYGHVQGAYQLSPGSLTTNQDLSALHPANTNVLYCWTGQTSAFVGFYLNVLGYDLLSLRFGANALIHDDLPLPNRWEEQGLSYPLE